MLKVLAGDGDPRVRLEAVRAASFSADKHAPEVLQTTAREPLDTPLRYAYEQAMKNAAHPFPRPSRDTGTRRLIEAGHPAILADTIGRPFF